MGTFAIDLAKYAETTKQSMGEAVREVVMTAAAFVDERSPVGNRALWTSEFMTAAASLGWIAEGAKGYIGGHFRANNQYQFGTPPTGEIAGTDESGEATMARIKAGVMTAPIAGMHYIANNVPYARALENGHSTQAPQGIYSLAAIDTATVMRGMM